MRHLQLTSAHVNAMVSEAKANIPQEVCGLLVGDGRQVTRIIPIANVADTPETRYTLEPSAYLAALRDIDATGEMLLGIYHSHPRHAATPSWEDIREAALNTPDLVHLIISLRDSRPELQGWSINTVGEVASVELVFDRVVPETIVPPLNPSQQTAIVIAIIVVVALLLAMSFNLLPPAPPLPIS